MRTKMYLLVYLLVIVSFSSLFGKNSKANNTEERLASFFEITQDTTCGLVDTVFQVNPISCNGAADASATIQIQGATGPLIITWDNGNRGNTATGLSAGLHFVSVTDVSGCTLIDSIIIEDKAPLEYTLQTTDALCLGVDDGTATIIDSTNLSFTWSTGDTINNISNLAPGTYAVTIDDGAGCVIVESFDIASASGVVFEISIQDAFCIGIDNGSISINDTLNLSGYSYAWSTGDTTNTISNLNPLFDYAVTVTSDEGCQLIDTLSIGVENQLLIEVDATNATCEGVEDGRIVVNDTLDITGLSFGWSTGDTTQSITGLSAGEYGVVVADTLGCLAAAAVTIGNSITLDLMATTTDASCEVADNGTISIVDTASNFTYTWSTGDSTQMINGLAAGTYGATITDIQGCQASDSITVGITQTLILNSTVSDATCNGIDDGNIVINEGQTGLVFTWNTGDSTQAISNLSAGTYTVSVTDTLGCTADLSVMVGAGPSPQITISKTDESCAGLADGSIIINDTIDNSLLAFAWSTGDSTNSLTNLSAGTYVVTVTDTLGCFSTESIEIVASAALEITLIASNVSCDGLSDGAIALNEGNDVSNLNILWSTGDSTQTVNNLSTGTYFVTVSDTTGCEVIDSVLVMADSSLLVNLTGNDISCVGGNDGLVNAAVIGFQNTDNFSFLWNTGDTVATIRDLMMGTYSVVITDTTGCMGEAEVSLAEGDTMNIDFVVSDIACMDTTGTGAILAVPSGGAGDFSFLWNTGDSTNSIINLVAGRYVLTITDALGCTLTDSVVLTNPPDLIISAAVTQDATCVGTQDGIASVAASAGTPPYNINWSNGQSTSTIGNLDPGLFSVTVTDQAGCELIDSVNIQQTTELSITLTEVTSASSQNSADAIATVDVSGGLAPYTFLWDNGEATDSATALSPGLRSVTVTDANGCADESSIDIQFFDLAVNIIEVRNLRCNGDNSGRATAAPVTGTAPFTYVWSTGDTTPIVNNFPAGMHTVTVTDIDGLRGTASVTLTEPEAIYFNLEIIPPGCPDQPNGRITINATGIVGNPLYDFGVGFTQNPVILGVSAGTKNYAIIDGRNCRADTTFVIEALSPSLPEPTFTVQSIGTLANFTNTTEEVAADFLWKFGDGATSTQVSPSHIYPDTGNYEVCLIVNNNCGIDSLCQIIRIDPIPVPPVELNFGRDTSSLSGQVVQIPVMVGAFEDVASISGTFELTNPSIGAIQGIRALNLPDLVTGDFTVQPNLITLDWSVADTAQLVSLPQGTQIFTIDLLLTGASEDCTEIVASNNEIELLFTKGFMGNLVPAPFIINSAEICIAPTVSIAGNVSREEEIGVQGVSITTNNENPVSTTQDGNYAIPGLPGGATYNLEASKSDDILEGVTAFDLVRILQHILTLRPLISPYRIIAADIDNSRTITSLDLVHLQRLILEQTTVFPNNQPWRFVPETYVFPNPTAPFAPQFPETIELTRLEVDTANVDFVAIKIGDVVGDPAASNARFLPKSLGMRTADEYFHKGDIVEVPFSFDQVATVLGLQFELTFDNTVLAFHALKKDNYLSISENNLGLKHIEEGRLKFLWLNQQQLPIRPLEDGLFALSFEALQDGRLSDVLQLSDESFEPALYIVQGKDIGVQSLKLNIQKEQDAIVSPIVTAFIEGEQNTDEGCADGLDNDADGLIDCADADCFCECNTSMDVGNLIVNPSAELPIDSGWTQLAGNWETRGANPDPQDGAAYFYPANSALGELFQSIDLSADSTSIADGLVTYTFSGYVRTFNQLPSDEASIILQYKDVSDSILYEFRTGTLTSGEAWLLVSDTVVAPPTTALVDLRLVATRVNGSNNDAYFDNLSLTRVVDETCVSPCDSVGLITLATDVIPNLESGTATANFFGGTGPLSFRWSTGDSTMEISNLDPDTYIVEVSDSIGCTLSDSVTIFIDSSFVVALNGISPTCVGDSNGVVTVDVFGGTAPFSFEWSDSLLTGDSLFNIPAGLYEVTVTDSTGQTAFGNIELLDGAIISLNIDSSKLVNETCPGVNDGRVSLVAQGGTAPYFYILNGDTTNTGVYDSLPAQQFPIRIIDSDGCIANGAIFIENTFAGIPTANFTFELGDSNSVNLTSLTSDTSASFIWTFGDGNNSVEKNPTATYAEPGVYEICLTVMNPCGSETSCQTVTVGISGPVTFIINDINGTANDTVFVPVTVQNFIDIVSFQKTIQIQDTAIARFLGISNLNLDNLTLDNFHQVDDHTITNAWFDPTVIGQDVPNNTIIYELMVMVNAQVDTCVGITIENGIVPIQVGGIILDSVGEVPFATVDGEVCTRETAQIMGNIVRETGSAVPGVQINIDNLNTTPTTDGTGNYLAEKLALGADYVITPFLNTPLLESVSTFDIVLINRHILGNRLLDSPLKMIAADVNRSGTITVFDLVLIQRAILGLNRSFPGNNAWRFIPTTYEFPDPTNPFLEAFPESIEVTALSADLVGQDFIGIKIGDVSFTVPGTSNSAPRSQQNLSLIIDNQAFDAGDIIQVPFNSRHINWLEGFQLELDFDPSFLELTDLSGQDLSFFDENNIGLNYLEEGKIQMLWVNRAQQFEEEGTLFNLTFKAKKSGRLNQVLSLDDRYLDSEAYSNDLSIGEINLSYQEQQPSFANQLAIYPNPTTGLIDLTFSNINAEPIQILLLNFTGQVVRELRDITSEQVSLDLQSLSDGTYVVVLKKADGLEISRVVLSR